MTPRELALLIKQCTEETQSEPTLVEFATWLEKNDTRKADV